MTLRERHLRQKTCQHVDRLPWKANAPWAETLKRWRQEGLGEGNWEEILGVEPEFNCAPVNLGLSPWFEEKIIEDKGETQICQDSWGIIFEARKDGCSMPRWIEHPVKCRSDWERLRDERLNPDDPARFPEDWAEVAATMNADQDRVTMLGGFLYGVFGTPRSLLGTEEVLVTFFDDPDLMHEMMDYLTDFWIAIYEKVVRKLKVDVVHIWEDMAGKNGSLISPELIREFMLPNYIKVKQFVDKHDIPIFSGDSDGNLRELVPIFHEVGVNRYIPFEVVAGNDILEYRRRFPDLCINGGIDKRVLAIGREAWQSELNKVREMLKYPGYEPSLDHAVPPDVSWQNFYDFHMELKEVIYG